MRLLVLLITAFVAGCATQIRVDYISDPPGATLYDDGRPLGVTPVRLSYPADEAFKGGQCQDLKGTTAVWASGARAEVSSLNACRSVGWIQSYVFVRPDVPGREVDMNFALQLQRNGIMQQQVDNAAAQNAINAKRKAAPKNCTTVFSGYVANTTCY